MKIIILVILVVLIVGCQDSSFVQEKSLSLLETFELTQIGNEYRPELLTFDGKYFVIYRKEINEFRAKEIDLDSLKILDDILLYPLTGSKRVTDFGSLYANENIYLAFIEEGETPISTPQYLNKYDKEFNLIKSIKITQRSPQGENVDDPAMISDDKYLYLVNELISTKNKYKLYKFDFDLNLIETKEISTPGFDGGDHKLISVEYINDEFVVVGEFVPEGYSDIDNVRGPISVENGNKDLFVAKFDNNWNLVSIKSIITSYPEIETYATSLEFKDRKYYVAYTSSDDAVSRAEETKYIGFGKEYLAVYDKNFNFIEKIILSDKGKMASQGSITFYNNKLFAIYNQQEKDGANGENYLKVFEIK